MKSIRRFIQRNTLLFLVLSVVLVCGLIRYVKITTDKNTINLRRASVPTDTLFTDQHGINCLDIYNMDPVAIGKALELRKKKPPTPSDMTIVTATLDCGQFVASRGYSEVQISEQEADFPLAFSLVVHKDAHMVERLLRAIYVPNNVYCIHYDLKSPSNFTNAIRGLARCLPNVFVASQIESVQYGGISRLRADLNCLSDLLNSKIRWRYVINLCGQDFPLRSNAELVSELKALKGVNMLETLRPSTYKKQRFNFHFDLKDAQSQYYASPVKTARKKEPPPHNIEIFVGSAYFALSREFINFMHWSPQVKDFLEWSEDTYSPDEHFWASLVRIPGVPGEIKRSDPDILDLMSRTRLVKWHQHEGKLYPACTGKHVHAVCIYGAAELRWLLNDGHWFANKFDPKVDPVVIECLEKNLTERQKNSFN